MAVYKRGNVWWFKFTFKGELIRESSNSSNKRTAEQIEAARKTQFAKGEVGIETRKAAPTLREFGPRFMATIETVCAEKPRTIRFYGDMLANLLTHEPLAGARIDMIDEEVIDGYKDTRSRQKSTRNRPLAPASINRELATLRRLLRLAHEWKVINRVPRIKLLRGEKNREFVLSRRDEPEYLAALPQPLQDVAATLIDTGLRVGEALSLEWPQVQLQPANGATFGYLTVLSGKAKSRKSRNVPLSPRVSEILERWKRSKGNVFHADDSPLIETTLAHQHKRIRELLGLPVGFVLHSLRHTFGTRLGETGCDAFGIMKLMGHSSITVSQRYVHPSPEAIELAFGRMVEKASKVGTKSGTPKKRTLRAIQ